MGTVWPLFETRITLWVSQPLRSEHRSSVNHRAVYASADARIGMTPRQGIDVDGAGRLRRCCPAPGGLREKRMCTRHHAHAREGSPKTPDTGRQCNARPTPMPPSCAVKTSPSSPASIQNAIDRRVAAGLLRVTMVPVRRSPSGEIEKTMPRFTQSDVDAYLRGGVVSDPRPKCCARDCG